MIIINLNGKNNDKVFCNKMTPDFSKQAFVLEDKRTVPFDSIRNIEGNPTAYRIRDMFTEEFYDKFSDVDILNDCIDEYAPAFCGPLALTDKGLSRFADVLDIEVHTNTDHNGYTYVECIIDYRPDGEEMWERIKELFASAAGYCTEDEYEEWFELL